MRRRQHILLIELAETIRDGNECTEYPAGDGPHPDDDGFERHAYWGNGCLHCTAVQALRPDVTK